MLTALTSPMPATGYAQRDIKRFATHLNPCT